MKIDDISLTRSLAHLNAWRLYVRVGEWEYSGYFEDVGGFVTGVTEMLKFFAIRAGKLRVRDAGLTRPVALDTKALPGDRAQ